MDYGIISADDHVVEPPDVWTSRLPARYRDIGPHVVRQRVRLRNETAFDADPSGPWADIWRYEDIEVPMVLGGSCAGVAHADVVLAPVLFEEMRPGAFCQADRLTDMDINHVDASMCFPNMFVRFTGQRFSEAKDKDLALLCVQAYNDWMVDEWCAGSDERLIPLCIVPMWDPALSAAEVRRNADRGVRAVCFSELPTFLGLPSIHSGAWEPFIEACEDTDTVINLHIGSGSKLFSTSDDAPGGAQGLLTFVTPAMALVDWLLSGHFVRHPRLTVALAESNIGWLPYVLERADRRWEESRGFQPVWKLFDRPPSSYFASNMYASFFNDRAGLAHIQCVGVEHNLSFENLTFESDYPHSDGTWPDSLHVAKELTADLDLWTFASSCVTMPPRQLRINA